MSYKNHDDVFRFHEWANLTQRHRLAFESARHQVLQNLIESAPPAQRQRLPGSQWQIDRERDRSDNPMSSCLRISSLMWGTVLGDNGLVDKLDQLCGVKPIRQRPALHAAELA